MQDWKPSVPETGPAAEVPDVLVESLQPSPHDMPALDAPTSSDPMPNLLSVPGPPQDPPSAPVHSMPPSQGADSVGAMPSATLGHDTLGSANQQSSMQQLQAALSAQSQASQYLSQVERAAICKACLFYYTMLPLQQYKVDAPNNLGHPLERERERERVRPVSQLSVTLSNCCYCVLLRCAVLCCAVLCCAVLCCAVPCRAMLQPAVLCCAVPCRAVPCCSLLCCAVLCCAVLCCAVLCCAVIRSPACCAMLC